MTKEVVIAAYDKNYNWTVLLENANAIIYLKGPGKRKIIPTVPEILIEPNVGRDVHTFYYHIVNNYNNLADYTFFSQDFPFDHVANYTEIINGDINTWNKYSKQTLEGCWFFNTWCDITECDQSGYPNHGGLSIKKTWDKLFMTECPAKINFVPAGHFCASKETIHKKPVSFYTKLLDLFTVDSTLPWIIERLNPYIFS